MSVNLRCASYYYRLSYQSFRMAIGNRTRVLLISPEATGVPLQFQPPVMSTDDSGTTTQISFENLTLVRHQQERKTGSAKSQAFFLQTLRAMATLLSTNQIHRKERVSPLLRCVGWTAKILSILLFSLSLPRTHHLRYVYPLDFTSDPHPTPQGNVRPV